MEVERHFKSENDIPEKKQSQVKFSTSEVYHKKWKRDRDMYR